MPMFVHNFTSYFHEKQRDLYFVTFSQVKKGRWDCPTFRITKPSRGAESF